MAKEINFFALNTYKMQCHKGNMIRSYKFPKHFMEFYLFFILINLSKCISIHPLGRYSNFQGKNELSTVPTQYQYPWTERQIHQKDHGYYDVPTNTPEKSGSFSDIFGENRRVEIQVRMIAHSKHH